MRYYTFVATGKCYTEEQLKEYFYFFVGDIQPELFFKDVIDKLLEKSLVIVEETDEEPSVIMYLNSGLKIHAIKRYRDIHGCDLREAKRMVELIEKDIAAIRKGEKRPWQV